PIFVFGRCVPRSYCRPLGAKTQHHRLARRLGFIRCGLSAINLNFFFARCMGSIGLRDAKTSITKALKVLFHYINDTYLGGESHTESQPLQRFSVFFSLRELLYSNAEGCYFSIARHIGADRNLIPCRIYPYAQLNAGLPTSHRRSDFPV